MRFIHPEYLWALFLLIIPVIIHLFRLRRFKTTPFTNVPFLKEIISESRKSRSLKKWLLLLTRLLLLTCLVLAFARPYLPAPEDSKNGKLIIYLDNSMSMQHPGGERSLLEEAVQSLVKMPEEQEFTLFTNDQEFRDVRIEDVRDQLLDLSYSPSGLQETALVLKFRTYLNELATPPQLLAISDFQFGAGETLKDLDPDLVIKRPNLPYNISVDSAWIPEAGKLRIRLSQLGDFEETPVSLYHMDTLIARAAVEWKDDDSSEITFSLPEQKDLRGHISISDNGITYDNMLFISTSGKDPIRVLSIGSGIPGALARIYTAPEFSLESTPLSGLNMATIMDQDLIILDQLERFTEPLLTALPEFLEEGGTVVIIPSPAPLPPVYNRLMALQGKMRLGEFRKDTLGITRVVHQHPFFSDIFQSPPGNFAYPEAYGYYPITQAGQSLLELQGGIPFLVERNNLVLFSSPLEASYGSLTQSPLIVPVFYGIGSSSRKTGQLYYTSGQPSYLDVPVQLGGDRILTLKGEHVENIPRQQNFANKTRLDFSGSLMEPGNYEIQVEARELGSVSFNYSRDESDLDYAEISSAEFNTYSSVKAALEDYEKASKLNELWKWFVILALLFLLAETAIQKFLK